MNKDERGKKLFDELATLDIDRIKCKTEESVQVNLRMPEELKRAVDLYGDFLGLQLNELFLYSVRAIIKLQLDPRDVNLELFSKQLLAFLTKE